MEQEKRSKAREGVNPECGPWGQIPSGGVETPMLGSRGTERIPSLIGSTIIVGVCAGSPVFRTKRLDDVWKESIFPCNAAGVLEVQ